MVMEGGEARSNTNINFLLEEFGIVANTGEQRHFQRGFFLFFILNNYHGQTSVISRGTLEEIFNYFPS